LALPNGNRNGNRSGNKSGNKNGKDSKDICGKVSLRDRKSDRLLSSPKEKEWSFRVLPKH
jgi:hypothetical protein